ncbi:Gfo/Idh/MocA family protein [Lactobacillus sp. PSON]|uniref:Gfo/Idh/MocA family protein n=1 Tax=Lactobacillus sp. PSON TaxID=3455454 RepID=UPI00404350C4
MKLGIIGSGKIVHDFLTTADKINGLSLAAISTTKRSSTIGQELAQKYHISKAYTSNRDLFNDENVDTVYVAVPNSLHYIIAKQALEAGKNVICEKPFVSTTTEARELKEIADAHNVIIVEAITNIHLENFKHIKEDLKKIAPVHILSLNYTQYSSRYDDFLKGKIAPVFDPKKDGGALKDLNIYNIHLAVGLFKNPKAVQYYPNMQRGIDTSGILNLAYQGMQASLIASKDSYTSPRSFIEGEKGSIFFDGSPGELNNYSLELRGQNVQEYNFNKYDHRMASEFNDFVEVIDKHDTKQADEWFEHSVQVLDILSAAKRSY